MTGTNVAYVGSKPGNNDGKPNKNEWRTPALYIGAVKQVLGDIDLDPFSCEKANNRIKANYIFTKENSALSVDNAWPLVDTAFANPPFGRSLMPACVEAWITAYCLSMFSEGILLCNNATETNWFGLLLADMSALCLLHHRIAFERPDGSRGTDNPRGQVFFYFGDNRDRFKSVFSALGTVLVEL